MHLLNESQPTDKNPIVNIVVELEGGERKPAVRAEIINSRQVSAEGITVRSTSPLLALCRKLAAAGYDPTTPLEAYRGDVLYLRVRSIGGGARLTVDEYNGPRFAKWKPFCRSAVSPAIRQNGLAAPHTLAGAVP